ncbi:MAG: class I tRNA ligase family protein, partial [Patescibacteria group bacterium]
HGLMIKDGAKMSKSKGNVVNPDEYIAKFGADVLRLYLMFMGPMDGFPDFRDSGMEGMQRFVNKLWTIFSQISSDKEDEELTIKMHQTIKKTTVDISKFGYNTTLSSIMEYVNLIMERNNFSKMYLRPLAQMIAPFAPHLAEEVWEMMGESFSIHTSAWPEYQEELTQVGEQTIVVQVNGKTRGQFIVASQDVAKKQEIIAQAESLESIQKHLMNKQIVNKIYVPGKIVNFVAK